jgi:hypothetical protein
MEIEERLCTKFSPMGTLLFASYFMSVWTFPCHFSMLRKNTSSQYGLQFPLICFYFKRETCEGMTNRNSTTGTPAHSSQRIDYNLKELDDRRLDIENMWSRSNDLCLLDLMNKFVGRGCVEENVLCSIMSVVGSPSHHSFVTNIFTGANVWLNQAFHTVCSPGTIPQHMLFLTRSNVSFLGTNKS